MEHRLGVLGRIIGTKRDEVKGGWRKYIGYWQ
jgi:hypothetical protein